jgi:hypothetical protein
MQKSFVQRLVSTISGSSIPILYYNALLFPKHFYCSATRDKIATLGCAPISCYRGNIAHPDGFASNLERGRNLITHASSSTATDSHFLGHLYDIQANIAAMNLDSRLISSNGFRVSRASKSGLEVGDRNSSELTENVDSSTQVMNLAAAAERLGFDLFFTFTCNQSQHPGIRHLYKWKENEPSWSKQIKGYDTMPWEFKEDIRKSMEMAYTHVLTRTWLEVRKIWLEFIIYSTSTKLGKTSHAFFRDEYQDSSGECLRNET